jgi:hypothetical protein
MVTDSGVDQQKRPNADDVSLLKQNLTETARRLDLDLFTS